MAHSSVFNHIKLWRLSRRLGVPKTHALGCLEFLWHYVGDHHCDGDISQLTDDEIEMAAQWEGKDGEFVNACIKERWIDRNGEKTAVHDWLDWCPDFVKKRHSRRSGAIKNAETADNGGQNPPRGGQRLPNGGHCPDNGESTQPNTTKAKPKKPKPVSADKPPVIREPNPLWDAVVETFFASGVPPSGNSRVGRIVSDLKALNVDPADVRTRAKNWATYYPEIPCTPETLVKHWSLCAAPKPVAKTPSPIPTANRESLLAELKDKRDLMASSAWGRTTEYAKEAVIDRVRQLEREVS